MPRRPTEFLLLLRGAPPDDVIATLERHGAIKSERSSCWLFPSLANPTIYFLPFGRREEDTTRLGLCGTIERHVYGMESSGYWLDAIERVLGISSTDVYGLIMDADMYIEAVTPDKAAACETLPRIVRAILETYDGIAVTQSTAWRSEALRAGHAEGLDPRLVLSIQEEYARSDAVFVGEVVTEQAVPQSTGFPACFMYTLTVDEVLRGSLPRTTAIFNEGRKDSFRMSVGGKYLLFVSYARGRAIVDDCGNSCSLHTAPQSLAAVRQLMLHVKHTSQ